MLTRWFKRRRWRHSPRFWEEVALAVDQAHQFPGGGAAAYAQRKAKRPYQPARRKLVWREAARQIEAVPHPQK